MKPKMQTNLFTTILADEGIQNIFRNAVFPQALRQPKRKAAADLHVTFNLTALPNNAEGLSKMCKKLSDVSESLPFEPFQARFDRLDVFMRVDGKNREGGILCLLPDAQTSLRLRKIQHDILSSLNAIGYVTDHEKRRPFAPHMTLAKIHRDQEVDDLSQALGALSQLPWPSMTVDHFTLAQRIPACHPDSPESRGSGSRYKSLAEFYIGEGMRGKVGAAIPKMRAA